jgi:type III pantothenate kinase
MPELVVDVGNSRMKWGLSSGQGLLLKAAVPLDDEAAWLRQMHDWDLQPNMRWNIAGTHPGYRNMFAGWLKERTAAVRILDDYRQIPLRVAVDHPEQIGIDRLLNALAIRNGLPDSMPAAIVGAGSAVTVDLLDREGIFRGGAILPGFRLMGKALNDHTAKLPLIETFDVDPALPGTNTVGAIQAGIFYAIRGGVERIIARYAELVGPLRIFVAGGDAELLADLPGQPTLVGPFLTLEGIRIAAERLP